MNLSFTGIGMAVWVITFGLNKFGIIPSDGSVEAFVSSIINIASFVLMVYGQYRRTDVKGFIFK